MIQGLGIDFIEVSRIEALMSKGDAFLNTVYTTAEIGSAFLQNDPAPVFAAMFAAKEAFVKALGTGFIGAIDFRQIEVQLRGKNNPVLVLSGEAGLLLQKKNVVSVHLSVAFTNSIALAVVILEN